MRDRYLIFALIILLALAVVLIIFCPAVEAEVIKIRQFGGVDHSGNPLTMPLGQADVCVNWDLGQTKGAMTPVKGFSLYAWTDSLEDLRGIFAYADDDGKRRFLTVSDYYSKTTWLGHLIRRSWGFAGASFPFSSNFDVVYDVKYYRGVTPSWAVMGNVAICANGKNFPIRYNGNNWAPLLEAPPGDFRYAPVDSMTDTYFLDGDYWYATKLITDSGSPDFITVPNMQIHVDSGRIVLWAPPGWHSEGGSYQAVLLRTRAGADALDSLFVIDTLTIDIETVWEYQYWIDSIPDDSLEVAPLHKYLGKADTSLASFIADTTSFDEARLGAVVWTGTDSAKGGAFAGISLDMENYLSGDTLLNRHIWKYTHYCIALYDSSTGGLTSFGPYIRVPTILDSIFIYDSAINLVLPRPQPEKDDNWRVLFRRMEKVKKEEVPDSSFHTYVTTPDRWGQCLGIGEVLVEINGKKYCRGERWLRFDTVAEYRTFEPWYPVDTLKNPAETTYTDTIPWADLQLRGHQNPTFGYWQMNYPTVFGNRVWMARGSYLHYCEFSYTGGTEIGNWPPGNIVAINPDDGDEITGIHASGVVFKNRSIYEIKEVDYNDVRFYELSRSIGCVAPHSIVDLPMGGYGFLSEVGFQVFSPYLQSPYKETGGSQNSISGQIQKHLDAYGINALRECHAWVDEGNRNLCLSFPSVDTTWVYAFNSGQWAARAGMVFRQTTRYSSSYATDLRPPSEVIGILNNSDSVFQLSGSSDTGKAITAIWKSAVMFDDPVMQQVTGYMIRKVSNDTTGVTFRVYAQQEKTAVDSTFTDSSQFYCVPHEILPPPGTSLQFEIVYSGDSITVQGVDIWYETTEGLEKH